MGIRRSTEKGAARLPTTRFFAPAKPPPPFQNVAFRGSERRDIRLSEHDLFLPLLVSQISGDGVKGLKLKGLSIISLALICIKERNNFNSQIFFLFFFLRIYRDIVTIISIVSLFYSFRVRKNASLFPRRSVALFVFSLPFNLSSTAEWPRLFAQLDRVRSPDRGLRGPPPPLGHGTTVFPIAEYLSGG